MRLLTARTCRNPLAARAPSPDGGLATKRKVPQSPAWLGLSPSRSLRDVDSIVPTRKRIRADDDRPHRLGIFLRSASRLRLQFVRTEDDVAHRGLVAVE
jgi:hypothetical protein